jgi:hypothetical protein
MYYDIYALVKERSRKPVEDFLSKWGEGLIESAVEYEYPRYASEPEIVYKDVNILIDRLLIEVDQPYAIYWTNPSDDRTHIRAAMLFFTSDGGLIVGLSSTQDSNPKKLLKALIDTVDGSIGKILVEQPPPDTTAEFIQLPDMSSHL